VTTHASNWLQRNAQRIELGFAVGFALLLLYAVGDGLGLFGEKTAEPLPLVFLSAALLAQAIASLGILLVGVFIGYR
jgi:hypothetical protein